MVNKLNETGEHPDCKKFLSWRFVNVAAFIESILADFGMEQQIDETPWSYYIDKIRSQFTWMCILQNDMASLRCGKDERRLNMANALRKEFNSNTDTAFYIILQMHEKCVSKTSDTCFQFALEFNNDPHIIECVNTNVDVTCALAIHHATAFRYAVQ